jgi:hypothetical protein
MDRLVRAKWAATRTGLGWLEDVPFRENAKAMALCEDYTRLQNPIEILPRWPNQSGDVQIWWLSPATETEHNPCS